MCVWKTKFLQVVQDTTDKRFKEYATKKPSGHTTNLIRKDNLTAKKKTSVHSIMCLSSQVYVTQPNQVLHVNNENRVGGALG
jgi:hypothetical protein